MNPCRAACVHRDGARAKSRETAASRRCASRRRNRQGADADRCPACVGVRIGEHHRSAASLAQQTCAALRNHAADDARSGIAANDEVARARDVACNRHSAGNHRIAVDAELPKRFARVATREGHRAREREGTHDVKGRIGQDVDCCACRWRLSRGQHREFTPARRRADAEIHRPGEAVQIPTTRLNDDAVRAGEQVCHIDRARTADAVDRVDRVRRGGVQGQRAGRRDGNRARAQTGE